MDFSFLVQPGIRHANEVLTTDSQDLSVHKVKSS